jgi:predicted kinase
MDRLIPLIDAGMPVPLADMVAGWRQFLPLLGELEATPQDPLWHGEGNVAVHTAMVLAELRHCAPAHAQLSTQERLSLTLGAVFHDIGKPLVTKLRDYDGKARIVSPRHAEHGRSYLALRLSQLELPAEIAATIMALTGYHHHPRRLIQDSPRCSSWRQLARQCPVHLLYYLEQADLRGRICQDLDEQLTTLEVFRLELEERGLWGNADPWDHWRSAIDDAFPSRTDAYRRHAFHAAVRDAEQGTINSVEEGIARAWQLRDTPAELTLLCGPSGAGKSEWIARHADGTAVVSLDDLRQEIAGKRSDQSMNGQVMQAAKERLKSHLRQGRSVIWDATNLRKDGRSWVAQLGYDYGAYVRIVALRTPVPTLLSRNRKRDHPVPGSVLQRQLETMEWPTLDEAHEVLFAG